MKSLLPLSRILVAMLLVGGMASCQAQQEEPAKPPPKASSSTSMLELSPDSPTLVSLKTEQVRVRPVRMMLKAQAAKILANENRLAHLSPRVPGRIVTVYANLGDRVKIGDRLALLDSHDLAAAQLEYRKARTQLSVAEKAFDRAKLLLDRKAIGTAEYQRREAENSNAQADVHESEERLHLLGMTEKEIARLTGGTLPHAEVAQVPLRAPFAGEIIQRNATVGEVVDPTKMLFTIADLTTVWVQADFPEREVSHLKVGLPIEVRIAAYSGEKFQGRISYVAAVVDSATRTVMVRSEVPNPAGRLRPEMFAEVSVVLENLPKLAVPVSALQQAGDKTIVFVAQGGGRFERRDVVIGPGADRYAPVVSGLTESDQVVTEGSYLLKSEALKEQMTGGQVP